MENLNPVNFSSKLDTQLSLNNIKPKQPNATASTDDKDPFKRVLKNEVSNEARPIDNKPKNNNKSNQEEEERPMAADKNDFIHQVSDQVNADTNKAMKEPNEFQTILSKQPTAEQLLQMLEHGQQAQTSENSVEDAALLALVANQPGLNAQSATDSNQLNLQRILQTQETEDASNPVLPLGKPLPQGASELGIDLAAMDIQGEDAASDEQIKLGLSLSNDNKSSSGNDFSGLMKGLSQSNPASGESKLNSAFADISNNQYILKNDSDAVVSDGVVQMTPSVDKTTQTTSYQNNQIITTVKVPVTDANWSNSIFERVTWLSNQDIKSASIQLNPPELGPLDIKVKITNDSATVNFVSSHAHVRDILETAVPKLREMLESNGLNLADVNVSDGSVASQQSQADAEGHEQQEGKLSQLSDDSTETVTSLAQSARPGAPLGLVDMYV